MRKQILEIDAKNYVDMIIGSLGTKSETMKLCYDELSALWERLYHKEQRPWKVCLWRYESVKRDLEIQHGVKL